MESLDPLHPFCTTPNCVPLWPHEFILYIFKCGFVLFYFYIPHISEVIGYLSFSIWFTLLSMVISRSINISKDFILLTAELYFIVCVCVCTTSYLSVDGSLGCFHVLAIINNAVMNIGVHWTLKFACSFSSGKYL